MQDEHGDDLSDTREGEEILERRPVLAPAAYRVEEHVLGRHPQAARGRGLERAFQLRCWREALDLLALRLTHVDGADGPAVMRGRRGGVGLPDAHELRTQ